MLISSFRKTQLITYFFWTLTKTLFRVHLLDSWTVSFNSKMAKRAYPITYIDSKHSLRNKNESTIGADQKIK